MSEFWKTTSIVLLTVILGLAVGKTERDISAVLSLVAACIAAGVAVTILEPVLNYLWELQRLCALPEGLVSVLLKAVGIALVAELSSAVCTDAGNALLGRIFVPLLAFLFR